MDDIYPLGQGNGLLTDIANFALNNIYQYGQRAKASNQQLSQGMSDVASGGSGDLLSDAISSARGVSPLYTGTVNWAGMAPNAIAALKQFGQKFPAMLGAAEAAPQNITSEITSNMPSRAAGLLRKPTPDEHLMRFLPSYADNPYTVGHEIQHSLNASRVAGTDPIDALTIGTLMRDILPSGRRGSLDTVLANQIEAPSLMQRFWSKVNGTSTPINITNPDRGLMRAAMDEALAYLGENAARPNASPMVKTLADRMGVNWENPRLPAGSAGGGPDLQASFNRFTGPATPGKDVIDKIYNTARGNAAPGEQVRRDPLVQEILANIGRSVGKINVPEPGYRAGKAGLGGISQQLGAMLPWGAGPGPLPIEDLRGILQHLDKNGLLNKDILNNAMEKFKQFGWQMPPSGVDSKMLERVRRFVEETKE